MNDLYTVVIGMACLILTFGGGASAMFLVYRVVGVDHSVQLWKIGLIWLLWWIVLPLAILARWSPRLSLVLRETV